jgi:energy-coupling factor transporter ATP-binding protein EcfA2
MKVVMLGNSGVGKTTYMASLYGIMQQKIGGFSLKANDTADGNRLIELANEISSQRYPDATSNRTEYDFYLQHENQDIFPFTWSDYRGSAIRSVSDDQQSKILVDELKEADGIMMFCDCEALIANNKLKAMNEIRRMTYLVTEAVKNIERPMSLVIILTKIDKIAQFQPDMFSPFEGLISIINASEWISASFIPVACTHQFINVPLPLLIALSSSVIYHAMLAEHLLNYHYSRYEEYNKNSQGIAGGIRWIVDSWNGNPTNGQLAKEELAKAVENYQIFEYIKEPVIALAKYLENIPTIQENLTLKDYATSCENIKLSYYLPNFIVKSKQTQDTFGWF